MSPAFDDDPAVLTVARIWDLQHLAEDRGELEYLNETEFAMWAMPSEALIKQRTAVARRWSTHVVVVPTTGPTAIPKDAMDEPLDLSDFT